MENGDVVLMTSRQKVAITPPATPAAAQSLPVITLHTFVATVNLHCLLDLRTITSHARNAEYKPKRFKAVIMRIREPETTAFIFASGKMVVTGAKSEDDSKLASRKYTRIIQKIGFKTKFTDYKIQNLSKIEFQNHLKALALERYVY